MSNNTGSPLWAVQKKIKEVLTEDPVLMSKVEGVFNFVRPNTEVPYVQLAQFTSSQWGAYHPYGRLVVATINVWSRYLGFKSAEDIGNDVIRLLVWQDLPLDYPWSNDSSLLDTDSINNESDGITRMYQMNLKFFVMMDENYVPPEPEL
jgi:hypothetical protein